MHQRVTGIPRSCFFLMVVHSKATQHIVTAPSGRVSPSWLAIYTRSRLLMFLQLLATWSTNHGAELRAGNREGQRFIRLEFGSIAKYRFCASCAFSQENTVRKVKGQSPVVFLTMYRNVTRRLRSHWPEINTCAFSVPKLLLPLESRFRSVS